MARKAKPQPPRPKSAPAHDPIAATLNKSADEAAKAKTHRCDLSFREFVDEYPPARPYLWGRHSLALAAALQRATETVERGGCYYCAVSMPPQHGKSSLCSRRYPPWHLARNPRHNIILATYAAALSETHALAARRCFDEAGKKYDLRFTPDKNQIGDWTIDGHDGGMVSVGIGGAVTGRGAQILVIDDYCKNREEAESLTLRDKVWESFRSDLITRLGPAHAVVIPATRWNEDDLVGRIFKEMATDPLFPRFELLNFPAQATDGTYLWPEFYAPQWYEARKAIVGSYTWQSLYQGDPQPRTGRMLRADLIEVASAMPTGLRWTRGWDLASTEKERVKDDPDYTVGVKAAFDGERLFVADVVRGQWSALERDKRIMDTARSDGAAVPVRIETVAGYKDTFTRIRGLLAGVATVRRCQPQGDKVSRAAALEPLFEAGRVTMLAAPWNEAFRAECLAFPKGKHDDQVDALVIAASEEVTGRRRMKVSS